jgi:hypothetical protein
MGRDVMLKSVVKWYRGYWRPFNETNPRSELKAKVGSIEYEFAGLTRDLAKVALRGGNLDAAVRRAPAE